jgi:hypothetical protein
MGAVQSHKVRERTDPLCSVRIDSAGTQHPIAVANAPHCSNLGDT